MRFKLAYGKTGLPLELDDSLNVTVVEPSFVPALADPAAAAPGGRRPNTESELRAMVGDAIYEKRRIVQNNTFDPSTQVKVGVTSKGHETWLNAELMPCDLKILTGFIEPHLFAGFSGGGKAILPGMAGQRTVLGKHDAGMIGHPKATRGATQG